MTFINSYEQSILSGVYGNFFDTFQRPILIYKKSSQIPIQNINPQNFVFGLGSQQGQSAVTYSQVTGIFPALISYVSDQEQELIVDANTKTTPGDALIKVKLDCRNFINNGETEQIMVDGNLFEIIGLEEPKTLLLTRLYQYKIQRLL